MKFFSSILAVLVLSLASLAQVTYPEGPNTGKANTPFSTAQFSATFNGPVEAQAASRSAQNTSTDHSYISTGNDFKDTSVGQKITVRFVDHDIAVDYTSSDFYANDDSTGGTVDTANTSNGVWEGHPYTYTYRTFTLNGVQLTKRSRYIIVNAREVIFVQQISLVGYEDRDQWLDFEYSLRIK